MSPRTRLDAAALEQQLVQPGRLWSSVDVVDSLPSSNTRLAERAAAGGCAAGAVVVAEEQTAGRGRRERSWVAPRGSSVMLSLLVRPTVDQASWGWLPLITALAITDGLQQVGVTAAIKWPNDVVVAQAKLAGILCEVVPTPEGSAVVVGWGVNVDQEESELPNPEATSVRLQHGAVDRAALLVSCLSSWEHRYREWATSTVGRDALSALYAQRSSTLGRPVTATLPGGEVLTGTALRLDPHGHLVVDVRGQERVVPAADVVHLRAAGLSP